MGRQPLKQAKKEYFENSRGVHFLFSSPAEYQECFKEMDVKYLVPATKGVRLGPDSFRVVIHLPNKQYGDRKAYLEGMKGKWLYNTFLASVEKKENGLGGDSFDAPIPASRIRWDSNHTQGAHMTTQTKNRKRVEFFLTPSSQSKGVMVNGQITFPSIKRVWHPLKDSSVNKKAVIKADGSKGLWKKTNSLVSCPVQVGFFGVSASKPGEYKMTIQPPVADCPKDLTMAGHSPPQFRRAYQPPMETNPVDIIPLSAESTVVHMAEENYRAFYDAQGMNYDNLLEIQDVEIMDSETEQQAIEREYYNPSEAMVGTNETLDGYRPVDSATVDLTSMQPTANYGAEGSNRMMCADCGSKKVMYAEGETATYSPSEEPDMVSSSSFENPTNANYSAEGETVADVEASVEPANEPLAVAEGTSLGGYAPIDSLEEGAPIGHGVNQYFGSAETVEGALLDESTTNIGIEEGVSLDNFSGVDSVVVEAPLGHGVTQWFAEGADGPQPEFDTGVTGQDGPSATPTNEYMVLAAEAYANTSFAALSQEDRDGLPASDFVYPKSRKYPIQDKEQAEAALYVARFHPKQAKRVKSAVAKRYPSLASENHKGQGYNDEMDESLGMRHRGSHSQSMKDRRDEASAMDRRGRMGRKYDDVMAMDAESHNRWHNKKNGQFTGKWSKHRKNGEFKTHNADTAGYLQDGSLSMEGYTPLESVEVDRTSFQPTQNYGAEYSGEGYDTFKTGAFFGTGWVVGVAALTAASMLGVGLVAKALEE